MKPPKIPTFVSIVILTTITIVFWVLFEVIRGFITRPPSSLAPEVTEPVSPNLDSGTIDKIEKSTFFEESQVPEVKIVSSPKPSP